MDMGQAKMSVGIGLQVFDEFVAELYRAGLFPQRIAENRDTPLGVKHTTVHLSPPAFLLLGQAADNDLRTVIHVTGQLTLRPRGEPQGAIILETPIDFSVRIDIELKSMPGSAPELGLSYAGVDSNPGGAISEGDIDAIFQRPAIKGIIDSVSIDILGPIVAGLGALLFDAGNAPDASVWSTSVVLMRGVDAGTENETVNAVGLFVNLPGSSSNPGIVDSYMPAGMGLYIVYSRDLLDLIFAAQAREQVGKKVKGATMKSLSLKMTDTSLFVNGKAEKRNAEITFKGPIDISMSWGYASIGQDVSKVSVDVDLPWYADLLVFFSRGLFFIPFLNLLNVWVLDPIVDRIEEGVDSAPDIVRSGLAGALSSGMSKLADGLKIEADSGGISPYSIPNHSEVTDGDLALYAEVIISPIRSAIRKATYSRRLRKFSIFTLENGRRFRVKDIAYLMEIGRIECPGYHSVGGKFIRANPDRIVDNNLSEAFPT
jgi:hypothetical protein